MKQELVIRDFRNKNFFMVDNEYLNGYAKLLNPLATVTYLSLCRHARTETQECFPSIKLIAKENNISERSVMRAIQLLEEWGIIKVDRNKGLDGKQMNNDYVLLDKSQWKKKPSDSQSSGQPSDSQSNSRVTDSHTNNTNINNTNIIMIKESKISKKERLNSGYGFKFESFWSAYPNKVAKGKAYEVFQLLTEEIQTICVNAINKQVENNHFWKDWLNDGFGGDNPPHPTTWLNQKRWEDNVVMIERKGKRKLTTGGGVDLTKR